MIITCRSCQSPIRRMEVIPDGGGAIFFSASAVFWARAKADDGFDWEGLRWLCRLLVSFPCFDCRSVDLAVLDVQMLLECEGRDLPPADRNCPTCRVPCLGPNELDCDGFGPMLAYLDWNYGANLCGSLCPSCGRVWLSLVAGDLQARRELASRFPDDGRCTTCGEGRLRVTRVEAPHCGFVSLWKSANPPPDRAPDYNANQQAGALMVVVCDSCGEAVTRVEVAAKDK